MKLRTNFFILLYTSVLMYFCASSSPLLNIMFNDSSVFIAMGRGMAAGKIMYKELFDHKGLYLYFVNYLAVLIGGNSQIGLFIVEIAFMFLSAKFIYASFLLYADEKVSWLGMQIIMLFASARLTFGGGNFAEEFALTFQFASIYILLKYLNGEKAEHKASYMFIHGVNAGIAFFLRANLIMMWGGIAILIGYDLLKEKNFAGFRQNLVAGLLGLLAGSAPVIIYVIVTNSVSDAIFGMFTYNLIYTKQGQNLFIRIFDTIFNLKQVIIISAIVISSFIIRKNKNRTAYFTLLTLSVLCISVSGRHYGHYYLYVVPMIMPAALQLASLMYRRFQMKHAIVMIFAMSIACGTRYPDYIREILGRRVVHFNEYVLHNEKYYSPDEKVLCTGAGAELYNRLGVIPSQKYFYIPSNRYENFPDPVDAQAESIISGVNDIIITTPNVYPETGRTAEINEVLEKNYILLYHDERRNIDMYGRK